MNELALFAGAGGGLLASRELSWRTIAAVEKEPYCREVLLRRQRDGLLPLFPIWDDIRTFDGRDLCGAIDIITAGFPCQPFSVAGKRKGEKDDRNLWPETFRVIREVQPHTVFLENVPGLKAKSHGYFGTILGNLAECGYDAKWCVLSAAEVGALHIRKRLWILAYTHRSKLWHKSGGRNGQSRACKDEPANNGEEGVMADANSEGQLQQKGIKQEERRWISNGCWWSTEPNVGRVAYGVASKLDRLRALGNGWVPQQAVEAYRLLTES